MLGKITLEQGSKVAMLKLAPLSDKIVDFMSSGEIRFPMRCRSMSSRTTRHA